MEKHDVALSSIRTAVQNVVRTVQEASGRPVGDLSDDTRPIGDLNGFDSLLAEEAMALLEAELGIPLEENLFTAGGMPITLGETIHTLSGVLTKGRNG